MTWVSTGVAVGGAVLGAMNSGSGGSQTNGGAGTTTGTKEPWLQAQPSIPSNLASGQAMQDRYTQTPFNPQQLNAYQNLGNQTNYMNNLVPSLLGQVSNQQLGFDRSNPNARPDAYNFNGTGSAMGNPSGSGGLLGMLSNPASGATSAVNPPPPPAAPKEANDFQQQYYYNNPATGNLDWQPGSALEEWRNAAASNPALAGGGSGGYGSFKYGAAMPVAGTQAYRDMSSYFANGGYDPSGLYGRGQAQQYQQNFNNSGIGNSGNSVGGSPSGDGSGAGGGGVW
jgi:hypothetical protein